jgi:tetratricopeptide (TPR) repeat protein
MEKQLAIIVLLILFTLASETAQGAGRSAILIGIDQYAQESQIPMLQSAASDAQKLSRILSQSGYECRTMTDDEATKERITEAFIQVEQQTGQTGELDVFLFHFSGRGTRIPDDIQADETQDGLDECILPSDAAADNLRSYIRDDALARWVSAVRAKQVILVLDCAFWGDETDVTIKGIGNLPEDAALDGVEIADGLPPDAVIIAAALPGARVEDGVFTMKLLEACVTEEADEDGDRIISFTEAYQHASRQLHTEQPPRLVDSGEGSNIPLAPLPPLSRIRVESSPAGAEILLYADSQRLPLDEPQHTPATVPLKHGAYQVQVRKSGFLIPGVKEVAVTEYDTIYPMDPFQLKAITVEGQVSTVNRAGESVPVEDATLALHVEQADKEIHQEPLPSDGRFRFEPAVHQWLTLGSEYELHITGQPVLAVKPLRFAYDGYADINAAATVTLDVVPPALAPNGVTFQATRLVVGEELRGSVEAQDDGLGLADSIDIQLQPPGTQEPVSIPASQIRVSRDTPNLQNLGELIKQSMPPQVRERMEAGEFKLDMKNIPQGMPNLDNLDELIRQSMPAWVREQMEAGESKVNVDDLKIRIAELSGFQTSRTYQFRYTLLREDEIPAEPHQEDEASPLEKDTTPSDSPLTKGDMGSSELLAGEWGIAALTLHDKAGNTTHYSADQINATFLVFASRYLLGKYYFDAEDYTEALSQFEQVSPPSDDARYLTALVHYHQNDLAKALATFQTIETKTDYLGTARRKETPQMPRPMVNKLWGDLLEDLGDHRTDAEYMSLLAATAEELGRDYDAKVYRENAERLREGVRRKE